MVGPCTGGRYFLKAMMRMIDTRLLVRWKKEKISILEREIRSNVHGRGCLSDPLNFLLGRCCLQLDYLMRPPLWVKGHNRLDRVEVEIRTGRYVAVCREFFAV